MALSDKPILNTESKPPQGPIIAMVAGEASGDTLGEGLLKVLKARYPNAQFVGVGGPKMIAQGFHSLFPMERLSVMGIFEVLKHLPELLKLRKALIQELLSINPAVFIGIDAPDFNFKVEKNLKLAGIKTVHYVGPSVWAWREKRLEKIKTSVDGVLVLFPFEPDYYHKYDIPVQFVGHPLANQVPEHTSQSKAIQSLKLESSKGEPFIGLLPGSRMSEILKMSEVYLQAAIKLRDIYPNAHFLVPCIHQKAYGFIEQQIIALGIKEFVSLFLGQAQQVMEASDCLIVTSGTATLEAALMRRPMVIAIKVHPISYWIMKKLSTTKWIGLPNILANEDLVAELIQEDATADKIALAMGKLISDPKLKQKQLEAFNHHYVALKQNASELAADAIASWANLSQFKS